VQQLMSLGIDYSPARLTCMHFIVSILSYVTRYKDVKHRFLDIEYSSLALPDHRGYLTDCPQSRSEQGFLVCHIRYCEARGIASCSRSGLD